MKPSDELKKRLLAQVKAAPSPSRSEVTLRRAAAALSAVACLTAGLWAMGSIHWEDRPRGFVLAGAAGWIAVALGVTGFALLRRSALPPSSWAVLSLAGGVPALLFGWLLLLNFRYPETFAQCGGRIGLACLDLTLTTGAVPVLAMVLSARRALLSRPWASGLLAGLVVGAWCAVVIHLGCECTNPSHVALGHVLPVVVLAGFGMLLGARLGRANLSSVR